MSKPKANTINKPQTMVTNELEVINERITETRVPKMINIYHHICVVIVIIINKMTSNHPPTTPSLNEKKKLSNQFLSHIVNLNCDQVKTFDFVNTTSAKHDQIMMISRKATPIKIPKNFVIIN